MPDGPNSFGGRRAPEEVKQMRREYPSGWLELSMFESLALMIDAIIDAPPDYSFSNPELAERAGISAESVRSHIDTLKELGIVSEGDRPTTFQVNEDSRVLQEIFGLNDAVNAVRSGASPFVSRFSIGTSPGDLSTHIPDDDVFHHDKDKIGGRNRVPGAKDIDADTAFSFS